MEKGSCGTQNKIPRKSPAFFPSPMGTRAHVAAKKERKEQDIDQPSLFPLYKHLLNLQVDAKLATHTVNAWMPLRLAFRSPVDDIMGELKRWTLTAGTKVELSLPCAQCRRDGRTVVFEADTNRRFCTGGRRCARHDDYAGQMLGHSVAVTGVTRDKKGRAVSVCLKIQWRFLLAWDLPAGTKPLLLPSGYPYPMPNAPKPGLNSMWSRVRWTIVCPSKCILSSWRQTNVTPHNRMSCPCGHVVTTAPLPGRDLPTTRVESIADHRSRLKHALLQWSRRTTLIEGLIDTIAAYAFW